jgi:hypothetical protein
MDALTVGAGWNFLAKDQALEFLVATFTVIFENWHFSKLLTGLIMGLRFF